MKKIILTLAAFSALCFFGCGEASNPTASDISNNPENSDQISSSVNYNDEQAAPVLPKRKKNQIIAEQYDHSATKK